jgi:hypothetical protein
MDEANPPSLALRLMRDAGLKKSTAYMIASGERRPSLKVALRIRDRTGLLLGPLQDASPTEVKALERVAAREAAA